MPTRDRVKLREYERRYAETHREKVREKARNHQRRRWQADPELAKRKQREYRAKVRERALVAYGGVCACCGETELHFLSFDHINGGGSKERKVMGMTGSRFYLDLLKTHRDDIRVLCFNCNYSRNFYGACPHDNK